VKKKLLRVKKVKHTSSKLDRNQSQNFSGQSKPSNQKEGQTRDHKHMHSEKQVPFGKPSMESGIPRTQIEPLPKHFRTKLETKPLQRKQTDKALKRAGGRGIARKDSTKLAAASIGMIHKSFETKDTGQVKRKLVAKRDKSLTMQNLKNMKQVCKMRRRKKTTKKIQRRVVKLKRKKRLMVRKRPPRKKPSLLNLLIK